MVENLAKSLGLNAVAHLSESVNYEINEAVGSAKNEITKSVQEMFKEQGIGHHWHGDSIAVKADGKLRQAIKEAAYFEVAQAVDAEVKEQVAVRISEERLSKIIDQKIGFALNGGLNTHVQQAIRELLQPMIIEGIKQFFLAKTE